MNFGENSVQSSGYAMDRGRVDGEACARNWTKNAWGWRNRRWTGRSVREGMNSPTAVNIQILTALGSSTSCLHVLCWHKSKSTRGLGSNHCRQVHWTGWTQALFTVSFWMSDSKWSSHVQAPFLQKPLNNFKIVQYKTCRGYIIWHISPYALLLIRP